MAALRFERIQEAHLPAILEIEKLSQSAPWSIQNFRSEITNEQSVFFVGFSGKELVCYGGYWRVVDEAHITTIAVAPEFRRTGLGTELVSMLVREARATGLICVTLEVRESNTTAQNLYRRLGFQVEGLRRRYYPDNHEAAVIMWLRNLTTWEPPK